MAGLLPGCDKKAGRMMQEYSENQGRLLLSFTKIANAFDKKLEITLR